MDLTFIVPIAGLAALAFAGYLAWDILRQERGTKEMRSIADSIMEGAKAFLKRQYTTIAILAGIFAAIFAIAISANDLLAGKPFETSIRAGLMTAGAFGLGALFSAISGYVGMHIAIRANSRTANNARTTLVGAVRTAMRGGAVSGFAIVTMSVLGVTLLYFTYSWILGTDPSSAEAQGQLILSIVGFGFGASLVALFAQLGGGIYTKAADVGADLVGKVELGIPEDDPRNPAVIADLVGDNVGDCAGRGADIFESTAAENIGAMVLGVALFPYFGISGVLFPLVARAFGLIATIVGVLVVRGKEDSDPMKTLNVGYYVTTILAAIFFAFAAWVMLQPSQGSGSSVSNLTWFYFFLCGVIGMITSVVYVFLTQYYTESKYRPVKAIARSSKTGPATNIIEGFSVGMEATALPAMVVSMAILVSFFLGELSGIPGGGFYGTAIATMGMLATAAYILAMDTFGPIADNAAGIIEMSGGAPEARKKMDRLDAVGNTTKALTKGYAVGSAALAAFLLFNAYLEEAHLEMVDLSKPGVFVGGIIGVVIVFLFTALAIRAVGKAAYYIINDVRSQFKEDPEIMVGRSKPDYARSVDICTKGALKEMVAPGLIAILGPVTVGLLLKAEALGATLMIGTIAGVILALVLNTGGGAWDNAKKYIEAGKYGGKGTDIHKASIVGDTVGDPFKDTAGPSLHILVKLLSTITLVLAALFIVMVAQPDQIYPANEATGVLPNPTFKWEEVPNAQIYQLQICNESDFKETFVDIETSETSYALTQNLTSDTTYYWRVRAFDGSSWSKWTEPFEFRVT
ncbi:MAG: sodium-translocating pyrophosphatase [Thermoplasmata archaeon]